MAQRVCRGIDLLFHDRGTRRKWVVSSALRPHFIPRKDPEPILQEAGWAPGPIWTGGKSRPHRDSIPDLPARSQSLYRLTYPAHSNNNRQCINNGRPMFAMLSDGQLLWLCDHVSIPHSLSADSKSKLPWVRQECKNGVSIWSWFATHTVGLVQSAGQCLWHNVELCNKPAEQNINFASPKTRFHNNKFAYDTTYWWNFLIDFKCNVTSALHLLVSSGT